MTNKDYLTFSAGGAYCGGEETTQYNWGQIRYKPSDLQILFRRTNAVIFCECGVEAKEIQVLQAETSPIKYKETGKIRPERNGGYIYVRVLFVDGGMSDWICRMCSSSDVECSRYCCSFILQDLSEITWSHKDFRLQIYQTVKKGEN